MRGEPFKNKYVIAPSGCWEWRRCRQIDGYGTVRHGQKTYLAHRLSWELHRGTNPGRLYVLHKCDNPACVNPAHLFLGTQTDNMRDMKRKGRGALRKGERHPRAKFTEREILEIRGDPRPFKTIAAEYDTKKNYISRIKRREVWGHI